MRISYNKALRFSDSLARAAGPVWTVGTMWSIKGSSKSATWDAHKQLKKSHVQR